MNNAILINFAFKGIRDQCKRLGILMGEESISEEEFQQQINEIQGGLSTYRNLVNEFHYTNISVYREVIYKQKQIDILQADISDLRKWGERRFEDANNYL